LAVDEALDSMNEMVSLFPFGPGTEEEKKQQRQEFQKGPATKYAAFAEKKIEAAGGKGFASTPSVADVMLMCQVNAIKSGVFDYIDTNFYDSYPGILATCKAITDTLMANEKAAAYIKSRE
jgi:glutathione S-transferase